MFNIDWMDLVEGEILTTQETEGINVHVKSLRSQGSGSTREGWPREGGGTQEGAAEGEGGLLGRMAGRRWQGPPSSL